MDQPFLELVKLGLVACVVEHSNIDIAILHGVPIIRNIECLFCKSRAIAVVVSFVVAYDMQHVLIGNAIESEELERIGPLVVVAHIIHCVTQLDSEVIAASLNLCSNAPEAGKGVVFLNIGCQEYLLAAVLVDGRSEGTDIRPFLAIAYLEVIGFACFQSCEVRRVDSTCDAALRIGGKPRTAFNNRSIRHILGCSDPHLCRSGRRRRTAVPSNILLRGRIFRHIEVNILRQALFASFFFGRAVSSAGI